MATAKTMKTVTQPAETRENWTQYDPLALLKAIQAMRAEVDALELLAAEVAEKANRLRGRLDKATQLAVMATPPNGEGLQ